MLRRHRVEGRPVTEVATAFGVTFYQAGRGFAAGGLPGLLPRKRGPQGGHKCTDAVLDFVARRRADVRGEIALVLDHHPAHVAAATRRFLHAHRGRLRVHDLPGYAPDLNPDEHVWAHLKELFRRQPIARDEDLGSAVDAALTMLRDDRRLVRKFFGHPAVAYVKKALPW